MIAGVEAYFPAIFNDDRGYVQRMLRADDPAFRGFGEIYFSACLPGAVKAWHLHKRMTLNYMCIYGRVLLGLADLRKTSSTYGQTDRIVLGEDHRRLLVTIPPGIWNGFRALNGETALIANCATEVHQDDEIERLHPSNFPLPFDWGDYAVAG